MNTHLHHAPDLTLRAPRSPRAQLGGYVLLPRLLDKCRATIAGLNGAFNYGPPGLDRHFLNFVGIDAEELKAEVATGHGDGEILAWITTHAKTPRQPWEIAQWSQYQNQRGPDSDAETMGFFVEAVARHSTTREDITTWFALLDVDDHTTFGGQA